MRSSLEHSTKQQLMETLFCKITVTVVCENDCVGVFCFGSGVGWGRGLMVLLSEPLPL